MKKNWILIIAGVSLLAFSCKSYLKIDGTDAMTFNYSGSFTPEGYPSSISAAVTVDAFSLTYALAYSTSNFSMEYTLKNGSTTLFGEGISAAGTMTEAKAQELNDYYSDTTNTDQNAAKIGEFTNTAEVYYYLMGIKIVGSVDASNLTKYIRQQRERILRHRDILRIGLHDDNIW